MRFPIPEDGGDTSRFFQESPGRVGVEGNAQVPRPDQVTAVEIEPAKSADFRREFGTKVTVEIRGMDKPNGSH